MAKLRGIYLSFFQQKLLFSLKIFIYLKKKKWFLGFFHIFYFLTKMRHKDFRPLFVVTLMVTPPLDSEGGELESCGQRLISSFGKTKGIGFFFWQLIFFKSSYFLKKSVFFVFFFFFLNFSIFCLFFNNFCIFCFVYWFFFVFFFYFLFLPPWFWYKVNWRALVKD